jgi:metallo-beta-lactamase family protein
LIRAKYISDTLYLRTEAPYSGDTYDLLTGMQVEKAQIVKVPPKIISARKRSNMVYERLKLAGLRLLAVIEQNRGGANKDLAKFTSQIEALCDKYENK